ncbi:MAG: hypothetical protein HOP29_19200, partial [Phycisphaerales bacterium]|nr:hypothetical protein [Phycisphaerales bacterium]
MGEDTRDLKVNITSAGGAEAAQAVGQVADAEHKLGDAVGGAAEETDKLKVSKESLANILSRINPAFGQLFTSLANAVKVSGELGGKQLSLN